MENTRVALVVCNAKVGETSRNLDKVARFAKEARKAKADIVCFPEMNVTGYSNHPDIVEVAESVPGPASQEILSISCTNNILILAGLAEKGEGGQIHASHFVAKPDGTWGVYRKVHIAPPEKNLYAPGDKIPIFSFGKTAFGIQLCYDAHFPELSTTMSVEGAEVLFLPHASPRGLAVEKHNSWMRHLKARAFDNSVFVIANNQTGANGKGLTFPGNAVAIDPSGHIIKKSLSGREKMLLIDLKADTLEKIRNNRMHHFLPNRRPEIY